ncbi:MAG: Asp23/Gls24 family envelope stress response protein [Clostridiales bacterium]|nr:Asp23/Gls24 family envelope stress response protein [Clostridiales bacterium]
MAKNKEQSYDDVYAEVISSIAVGSLENAEGIELACGDRSNRKANRRHIQVAFLAGNAVSLEIYVNARYGISVPEKVCAAQEDIKKAIEDKTKYKVEAINMHILSVKPV